MMIVSVQHGQFIGQRGHGGAGNVITFEDGRLYDLANVFMLAYPYGPQLEGERHLVVLSRKE